MRAVRCARDAALACACRPRALRARPRFARAAPFPSSLPGFSTLCARLRRVRLSPLSQDRHRSAGPTGEAPSVLRRARPSGGEIDIGPAWRAGPAYINLGPTEKSVRNGHETAFWHGIGSKSGCVRSTDSRDLGFFWQTLIRMTNSVPERGFMAIFAPDSRTRGGTGSDAIRSCVPAHARMRVAHGSDASERERPLCWTGVDRDRVGPPSKARRTLWRALSVGRGLGVPDRRGHAPCSDSASCCAPGL